MGLSEAIRGCGYPYLPNHEQPENYTSIPVNSTCLTTIRSIMAKILAVP
jgi:hypothetical protein